VIVKRNSCSKLYICGSGKGIIPARLEQKDAGFSKNLEGGADDTCLTTSEGESETD
jgi:hypothetical protein